MNILIILNDPPYGTERTYNALRLAKSLESTAAEIQLTLFLMSDSVACARQGQNPPKGFYNIELMLNAVIRKGGRVLLCGACMDIRGLKDEEVVGGATRSTMEALSTAMLEADKVLNY